MGQKVSGDHRPVRVTSIVGKIFERFLRDAVLEYLSDNNLITQQVTVSHGRMTRREIMKAVETLERSPIFRSSQSQMRPIRDLNI